MAKLIIVDDHPVTCDGLSIRIEREDDLEVVGIAGDIPDAIQLLSTVDPDLAVIDVSLTSGNGLELVKEIKTRFPNVRVLVWSMYDESLYADRAIQAGALGYINKKNVRETIILAIRTVLAGDVYLSPEYSAKVLRRLKESGTVEMKLPLEVLSDRELEAFALIGQGLKTTEIADRMELTHNTIETYRSRIKRKLHISHSAELACIATQWVLETG